MTLVNLNKRLTKVDSRSFREKQKTGKRLRRLLVLFFILIVILGIPSFFSFLSAKALMQNSKALSWAAKEENIDQIKLELKNTHSSVKSLNTSLTFLMWMKLVPFLGGYFGDVKHFVAAANYELNAAEKIVEKLEPYKTELGLTGKAVAGQDRVAQGLKVLEKVLPFMDEVSVDFKKARNEVELVDTQKYPKQFKKIAVRDNLQKLKEALISIDVIVSDNRGLLEIAPSALGATAPKNYLLLFQNDKEIRPTGGFITSFAYLKVDKGRIDASSSDDIYRLDEKLLKVCLNKICPLSPPEPIIKYLPEVDGKPRKAWSMRDSNLSPDVPTSAAEFERMYQMLGEGMGFDGVIFIDSQVVEEVIAITGPIDIFGTIYNAEVEPKCNCPKVIYELERYAEVLAKGEEDRKAVLGTLMQQMMLKTLGSGPDKMPAFINTGFKLANDKHIIFYMHDQKLQAALSGINWTGQIKKTDGDYLHINDANFAGGKSNLYVLENVTLEINSDNPDRLKHKLTIEYKNPEAYSTWLNGILRDYVRIYLPEGSKLDNSKGSDEPVTTKTDEGLNKTYFEGFITVRPQNSRLLTFEYTTPKPKGKSLPLLIQKQPGAKDHHYIVKVNGKQKAEFDLISDKELNLSF